MFLVIACGFQWKKSIFIDGFRSRSGFKKVTWRLKAYNVFYPFINFYVFTTQRSTKMFYWQALNNALWNFSCETISLPPSTSL